MLMQSQLNLPYLVIATSLLWCLRPSAHKLASNERRLGNKSANQRHLKRFTISSASCQCSLASLSTHTTLYFIFMEWSRFSLKSACCVWDLQQIHNFRCFELKTQLSWKFLMKKANRKHKDFWLSRVRINFSVLFVTW